MAVRRFRSAADWTLLHFHVAVGLSRRGTPHVIVMRNGQVVHDPHPTRDGLTSVEGAFVLLPVEEVTSKVYPLSGAVRIRAIGRT
jgi:hypothetical protein